MRELPAGDGWQYEPKWDGFRTIVFRDGDDVHLQSRNGKPMNRYFPEIVEAMRFLFERVKIANVISVIGRQIFSASHIVFMNDASAMRAETAAVSEVGPAEFAVGGATVTIPIGALPVGSVVSLEPVEVTATLPAGTLAASAYHRYALVDEVTAHSDALPEPLPRKKTDSEFGTNSVPGVVALGCVSCTS